MSGVHHQPQGPAFDIVLLLHVACVLVGLVTVVTGATAAARVRRLLEASTPFPEPVVRYFRPGVNWAGRSMYGIPIFGFALLAMSQGSYSPRDGWVMAGLAIFVVVILVAEGALWPAERRLQVSLAERTGEVAPAHPSIMRDASVMANSAVAALVLLVVGSVLMVAQP